jgi:hypothetical protein
MSLHIEAHIETVEAQKTVLEETVAALTKKKA